MSASMLTLRCANLCALQCPARAGAAPPLPEKGNGREPGLVMYCVSVKLHREGCCGLAEVNMWFPFGWLTKQPIPMATSCPTNPHYQSGCSFLHSHHCCKSCHQIHLHQSLCFPRGLQCFALYGCSRSLQSQASDGNL